MAPGLGSSAFLGGGLFELSPDWPIEAPDLAELRNLHKRSAAQFYPALDPNAFFGTTGTVSGKLQSDLVSLSGMQAVKSCRQFLLKFR